jgi:hypothetical protein
MEPNMRSDPVSTTSTLVLAPDRAVRIAHPDGVQLRGRRGRVWLTLDGELQDYFVVPGQVMALARSGPAVLTALDDYAEVDAVWPGRPQA